MHLGDMISQLGIKLIKSLRETEKGYPILTIILLSGGGKILLREHSGTIKTLKKMY